MNFIHALNLCPIVWTKTAVYVAKRKGQYHYWEAPGYEVYSIYGEIRAFASWEAANNWRLSELREYFNSPYRYDSAVDFYAIYF